MWLKNLMAIRINTSSGSFMRIPLILLLSLSATILVSSEVALSASSARTMTLMDIGKKLIYVEPKQEPKGFSNRAALSFFMATNEINPSEKDQWKESCAEAKKQAIQASWGWANKCCRELKTSKKNITHATFKYLVDATNNPICTPHEKDSKRILFNIVTTCFDAKIKEKSCFQ